MLPGECKAYVGIYEYGPMSLAVREEDGMLVIERPALGLNHLLYRGPGSFVMAEDLSYEVAFRLHDCAGRDVIVRRFGKTIAIGRRLSGRSAGSAMS
jgi:hypothetical protein